AKQFDCLGVFLVGKQLFALVVEFDSFFLAFRTQRLVGDAVDGIPDGVVVRLLFRQFEQDFLGFVAIAGGQIAARQIERQLGAGGEFFRAGNFLFCLLNDAFGFIDFAGIGVGGGVDDIGLHAGAGIVAIAATGAIEHFFDILDAFAVLRFRLAHLIVDAARVAEIQFGRLITGVAAESHDFAVGFFRTLPIVVFLADTRQLLLAEDGVGRDFAGVFQQLLGDGQFALAVFDFGETVEHLEAEAIVGDQFGKNLFGLIQLAHFQQAFTQPDLRPVDRSFLLHFLVDFSRLREFVFHVIAARLQAIGLFLVAVVAGDAVIAELDRAVEIVVVDGLVDREQGFLFLHQAV